MVLLIPCRPMWAHHTTDELADTIFLPCAHGMGQPAVAGHGSADGFGNIISADVGASGRPTNHEVGRLICCHKHETNGSVSRLWLIIRFFCFTCFYMFSYVFYVF